MNERNNAFEDHSVNSATSYGYVAYSREVELKYRCYTKVSPNNKEKQFIFTYVFSLEHETAAGIAMPSQIILRPPKRRQMRVSALCDCLCSGEVHTYTDRGPAIVNIVRMGPWSEQAAVVINCGAAGPWAIVKKCSVIGAHSPTGRRTRFRCRRYGAMPRHVEETRWARGTAHRPPTTTIYRGTSSFNQKAHCAVEEMLHALTIICMLLLHGTSVHPFHLT
jgi:hypothetical protein